MPLIELPVATLKAAVAASAGVAGSLFTHFAEYVATLDEAESPVEIDLSDRDVAWENISQDIARRSATLGCLTVATAFTCTKMRPDGFRGMAILITADAIKGKSTQDILEDFIAETEDGPSAAT